MTPNLSEESLAFGMSPVEEDHAAELINIGCTDDDVYDEFCSR